MTIKVYSDPVGTGTFTLKNPNTSNSQTVTLPDATTTLVGTDAVQTITNKTFAGVIAVSEDAGTISTGTYTPSPVNGNFKKYINSGSHTLAAPTYAGNYSLLIQVTNNGTAGTITFSGFAKVIGDVLTTTNGHIFQISITKTDGGIVAAIVGLQ